MMLNSMNLIGNYFEKKGIPDFKIEDIKLQIIGKFLKNNKINAHLGKLNTSNL